VTTYAIGDIQGCYSTLSRLLKRIDFDPECDRIWLVGDLVNRGKSSLEVLRWAKGLGSRLVTVLGNHDLHLLARAEGARARKPRDTLEEVLNAPDREELLDWLCRRPLLYREDPFILVHAGLLPSWSLDQAEDLAREVEEALGSSRKRDLLEIVYKKEGPPPWDDRLKGLERLRVIAQATTTLRTATVEGRPCPDFSGSPELAPPGCIPWFDIPSRANRSATVIFGHWAALGLQIQPGVMALDTGCVWGGQLTAVRLEDGAVFQEPSEERKQ
jgi:bis(5'-nucleosyl)-tetraphosphatase (symmetrical)